MRYLTPHAATRSAVVPRRLLWRAIPPGSLLVVLHVLLCCVAWGQRDLGTLTGTVSDQSGAVIAGATVTVTEVATGLTYSLKTDDTGVYARPALKPGTYVVQVEAQGFKTDIRRDVLLTNFVLLLAIYPLLLPGGWQSHKACEPHRLDQSQ